MRTGRPKSITKAQEKTIAECFVNGLTDEEAAFYVGISRKSIQRMRDGDLCPEVKKATLAKKMVYLKRLRDGRRQDWTRIAWYLERFFPGQLSKPEVLMQIQNNTLNQTTNNALILTAEVAEGVVSRIKSASSKVDGLFKEKRANGNGNGHKQQNDDG